MTVADTQARAQGDAHDDAIARIVDETVRHRRIRKIERVAYGIGFPVLLLALWELLVLTGLVDRRFFPPPTEVARVAFSLLLEGPERAMLFSDAAATLERLAYGFVLGSVLGIACGIGMGLYTPLRFALGPLVYATFPTPKLAIFPLLIVIFGLGDGSKTALITLGVFYMTCINTLTGVIYANPIYRDLAKAYRMPHTVAWFRVVVPSALPSIVAGLKLGLGQALILVVSAEFVSSNDGIGHFIWNAWQILDVSRMFTGLIVVALIGGMAVIIGELLERRLIPWATH